MAHGEDDVRKKKVLICGVCKNVAPTVTNTARNIEALGSNFQDYAVIIYENNSTDNTVMKLNRWAQENQRCIIITENLTQQQLLQDARCISWDGKISRMEAIARARNIVLSLVKNPKYGDFDYVIMADLDFEKPWPISEIIKTLQAPIEWDCVCANGIRNKKGALYDRYAYRDAHFPFGPELLKTWWPEAIQTEFKIKKGKRKGREKGADWKAVYSAFGGLAIYKRKSILNASYSGYVTDDLAIDYKNILLSLPPTSPHVRKYLKQLGIDAPADQQQIPILFINNSGYHNYPVCCEHVTFHASMRLQGHGKIYINPRMIMRYN